MNEQNITEVDSSVALTCNLVVYPEDEEAIQYVLNARRICVGRGSGSQIQVDHPAVSYSHLELLKNDSGDYEVRDLGSRNGLTINGEKVEQANLKDGDRMLIGGAIAAYFLILPDDAEAVDPVVVARDGERTKAGQFVDLAERTCRLEREYKNHRDRIRKFEAAIEKLEAELLQRQNLSESLPVKVSEPLEAVVNGSKAVDSQAVRGQVHLTKLVNRTTNGSEASIVNGAQAKNGRS